MATDKRHNDFKDKTKIAIITKVDPQARTVSIKYTNQAGTQNDLKVPYTIVGATWGLLYMPQKGDRVLIDNVQGEMPVLKSMFPQNSDFLPYLDPGEIVTMAENGSFAHIKNKRKRIISTGEVIDYDAKKGPNGETDVELEPGGVLLRARSKQIQDNVAPRWFNHSYLGLYDNGDINLQSMFNGIPKGLLHFDGMSGHAWWSSGDSKVQEYIELDPTKKAITIFSDGEIHEHVQTDLKSQIYRNQLTSVGNAFQLRVGQDVSTLPATFSKFNLESDLQAGDIRIANDGSSGKFYLHISSDCDILVDSGNVNITASKGNVFVDAMQDVVVHSHRDVAIRADGNLHLSGQNIDIRASNALTLSGPTITEN